MARALSKRGARVTVLEWDRTARLPKEDFTDGVRAVRLRLKGNFGFKAILGLPLWLFYVITFLARNRFEVVQPQNFDNLVPSLLLRPLMRFRIVYDLADFYADAYLPGHRMAAMLVRHVDRKAIRSVDALVMASEGQVSQVIPLNLPARSTFVHNTPTDNELETLSDNLESEKRNGALLLFYGGALNKDRMPLLVNLIMVAESTENLSLRIAGYGEGVRFFNGSHRNTEYVGRLTHLGILAETNNCDCVVIPFDSASLNDRIGLPNKLFEALAQGKPALTQRDTLTARIVTTSECGFVTDFRSPDEIRLTLDAILKNRKELPRMGSEGRKLFERKYKWSFSEERFVDLYRGILGYSQSGNTVSESSQANSS
jgi:glycosyltransferase involved in cell wall biosynthesis